ncbi:GntR family histidine utilization transcriptional repressor [Aminobacter aganoensis]|uniref:Histidine utilization repressor n=1 Tax=Aminobacter aganoensis TaxID=83264 RepID=A0A7X0F4Y1_9HYPH|nr:GntR family histidine utilization transcriptional repressor [Aminobacter aganoensis]
MPDSIADLVETPESGDAATSLYQRILNDIRDRIVSGEWEPGYRIPFEHELTEEYGCSRMTVNKALSQLAKAGLIERRRRSGSFVRRPQSQAAVLEIHDIRIEVEALGLPYRYELMSQIKRRAGAGDRDRLGSSVSGQLLALKCRHHAGARPFCVEDRLINLAAVPEAADEEFIETAPGPWLIGQVPWSAAEHVIRAAAADAETAADLGLSAGAPCLVIERRTWSAERPVTHVRFTYPANAHAVVARFTPSDS